MSILTTPVAVYSRLLVKKERTRKRKGEASKKRRPEDLRQRPARHKMVVNKTRQED